MAFSSLKFMFPARGRNATVNIEYSVTKCIAFF